jgi:hypothetical protein
MRETKPSVPGVEPARRGRRRFLQQVSAGAAAALAGPVPPGAEGAAPREAPPATAAAPLPTLAIGRYRLTRLVAGSNPIAGYSHSTFNLSEHMKEYFTDERVVAFVERCEQMGINAWQTGLGASDKIVRAVGTLRERGSRIHWFCLASEDEGQRPLEEVVALKPIAVVHHGGVTDRLFRAGQAERVHDFVKKAHDAGVLAGVSSHNPDNVAFVEEKGWENDFFMTCFYNVTRPAEEIRAKLGTVPLGEPFLESDREAMSAVVRRVKRPCLAFKILAAGHLCWDVKSVESAFEYAFSHIKKGDGVIVGMYPRFSDEISKNVALALKYAGPSEAARQPAAAGRIPGATG